MPAPVSVVLCVTEVSPLTRRRFSLNTAVWKLNAVACSSIVLPIDRQS